MRIGAYPDQATNGHSVASAGYGGRVPQMKRSPRQGGVDDGL